VIAASASPEDLAQRLSLESSLETVLARYSARR
jgi:hypothetical protein